MLPSHQELIISYRHLYKHLLRAVQYSKPARFVARNRLRVEYRNNSITTYDPARIARTLEFLDTAAKTRGLEHKMVKNLMHVWWEQQAFQKRVMALEILELRKTAFQDFGHTIRMLEETMGIYVGSETMKPNYFNPDGPFPG